MRKDVSWYVIIGSTISGPPFCEGALTGSVFTEKGILEESINILKLANWQQIFFKQNCAQPQVMREVKHLR